MRPRLIMVLALAAIVAGGVLLVPGAYAHLGADPVTRSGPAAQVDPAAQVGAAQVGAAQVGAAGTGRVAAARLAAPPPPTLAAAPVRLKVNSAFFSWALLDRRTGRISGTPNRTATNTTESMIKVWLVSDYLRRLGDKPPPRARLRDASLAIVDSDDNAAEKLFRLGGGRPVIDRMIKICGLTGTRPSGPSGATSAWWSYTRISAEDAVRMGECVKNGRAAGPKWTRWVLDEMTRVRGSTAAKDQRTTSGGGRWGIVDGLPAYLKATTPVAIKNGWTMINADGQWHLNCLAVADNWVLAVLLRYPRKQGLDYGAEICSRVATQLVTPQPGAAIKVPLPVGHRAVPRAGRDGAS
ncbi:serine hydrolase [Micromonospora sp. NPDC050397]|uniref:serine hydrolase n=1 Tax=Micromonospora sp. NPDC050397 TaxID=3364279 RepID=UPI00384D0E44